MIEGPGFFGIGTLSDWDEILRQARFQLQRHRLASYEGLTWPPLPELPPDI